jgi:hypothetical protein
MEWLLSQAVAVGVMQRKKGRQPRRIFITVTFSPPSLSKNSNKSQTQNNAEQNQDANIGTIGMRSKIENRHRSIMYSPRLM